MKAERLFQILGLVDESLIEEAVHRPPLPAAVQRRPSWVRLLAAGRMSRGDLRRGVGTVAIESGGGHRQPRRCRAGRWRIRR